MYDPNGYDSLRRRFQQPQPQSDIQIPTIQQPQPMMAQQPAPGPQQPMQWEQIDSQQQQPDMSGIGSLLKRFQRPSGAKGGSMGGFEGKA